MNHTNITTAALLAALLPALSYGGYTNAVSARVALANPIIVVKDLAASKQFYTTFLGYEVTADSEITAEVSKRTIGAVRNQRTRNVYLRSQKLQGRDRSASELALVHIDDARLPRIRRGKDPHDAVRGEVMLSLIVEGLEDVVRRMAAAGVTILSPVQLSATGKSRIASVLDPNGVRLEMYEYLP